MTTGDVAAFAVAALLLAVTPGPDMLLVARSSARDGRRHGLATLVGVNTGLLVHAAAAAVGLSAILAASSTAFTMVKVAGAGYLVVLGVRALWRARRREESAGAAAPVGPASGRASMAFRQGVVTNVLNPKVAVFFLAFLPQFTDPAEAMAPQTTALAGVFLGINVVVMGLLVLAVASVRSLLARPAVQRAIDGLSGVAFLGFGARLAAAAR